MDLWAIDEVHFQHVYGCPHWLEDEDDGAMHDDCSPECHVEVSGRETCYKGAVLDEFRDLI